MDDDMRADIAAAMGAEPDPAPAVDTSVDTSPPPAAEPAAAAPVESGTVRDALGRFVPKAKVEDNAPAAAADPGAPQLAVATPGQASPGADAAAAPVATPAPPSWSPVAREHWGKLPLEVQQEVHRRETEVQQFATRTQQARQAGESFMQAVQPYIPVIQAEGVDPLTAVTNLMQITARLRMGTPAEKASTVAQIVKNYGIDIRALDGALDEAVNGNRQPAAAVDSNYVQQQVQQALAPLMQAAQQRQAQALQAANHDARTELDRFEADPKHEFFGDLRATMADMVEVADRQGYNLSLDDAYQRAAMLHPEVSRVMLARQQGVNAQALTQAAKTARSAAVSIKGLAPVGNPDRREPSSVRESIEAAIEAHSRV